MIDYLTVTEAALRKGVSASTIKRWCSDEKVKAKKIGKAMWLIDPASLDRVEKDNRGRKRGT